MSMLSDQAKQLRGTAYKLDKIAIVSTPWIHAKLTPMLREAADTIESLRDRLQELQGVGGESNYTRLFGTPERAARTLEFIPCGNEPCSGCPIFDPCLEERVRPGALIEWLKGEQPKGQTLQGRIYSRRARHMACRRCFIDWLRGDAE